MFLAGGSCCVCGRSGLPGEVASAELDLNKHSHQGEAVVSRKVLIHGWWGQTLFGNSPATCCRENKGGSYFLWEGADTQKSFCAYLIFITVNHIPNYCAPHSC